LDISGIHHVTAITADAQKNIDFYCGVLGLRLVKLTVNFDDPGSYHLYYGNESGDPGSILTFFAWPEASRGRVGPAQVVAIAFAVPEAAYEFWSDRFRQHHIAAQGVLGAFGEQVISLADPDGIQVQIVAAAKAQDYHPTGGPIDPDVAVSGFHGIAVSEDGYELTARLLTDVMGFRAAASEGNRFRYQASGDRASIIDLLCVPDARHGAMGAGIIHHVAFRTPDDEQQVAWRERLRALGYNVTPVIDRRYFYSIYFREPSGVLFEIATDQPGFAMDEAPGQLGTALCLPPWLEPNRRAIEDSLPQLRLPQWSS